jgi:hypothetical protein
LLIAFVLTGVYGAVSLVRLLVAMSPQDWLAIAPAAAATFLRTFIALLIGTA